jgi:hypothetical protein
MFQKVVDLKVFTDIGHFTFVSLALMGMVILASQVYENEFEQ